MHTLDGPLPVVPGTSVCSLLRFWLILDSPYDTTFGLPFPPLRMGLWTETIETKVHTLWFSCIGPPRTTHQSIRGNWRGQPVGRGFSLSPEDFHVHILSLNARGLASSPPSVCMKQVCIPKQRLQRIPRFYLDMWRVSQYVTIGSPRTRTSSVGLHGGALLAGNVFESLFGNIQHHWHYSASGFGWFSHYQEFENLLFHREWRWWLKLFWSFQNH